MSMEENLRKYIDELIQEVEQELDETTTTAGVDGYQTPFAFGGGRDKDKKKQKKNIDVTGYTKVKDIDESVVTEAKDNLYLQLHKKYAKQIKGLKAKKIKKLADLVSVQRWSMEDREDYFDMDSKKKKELSAEYRIEQALLKKYMGGNYSVMLPKGTEKLSESINEKADYKYLTQIILDAKPKYDVYYNSGHNKVNIGGVGYDGGDLVKNFNQKPGSSSKIKNNFYHAHQDPQKTKREVEKLSKGKIKVKVGDRGFLSYSVNESVNEAKVKRPVNRWLELKNDDTMTANKKMAMGLKELKYQLAETEKFFNWYNKIKNINELDSDKYWKRTNKHIYKIKERLVNIAKTIKEIEK